MVKDKSVVDVGNGQGKTVFSVAYERVIHTRDSYGRHNK